ncbi:LysR family transcriptional regulator [Paracoccus sp. FO-3]|uniref:LysR family transcriptional regulator n=1 Tax=Paracoccus sp. FO-3 TaxID=1335059 RepID=UPI001C615498|nr:LysR family transcriptional regulator [Paracoccus sp. FO-3]
MDQMVALRVFRTVEQGSFTGAARLLKLSPAAASKNIGALEGHLNVRLLSLTEAGGRYFEQIARILDDLDEADRSLGPLQRQPSGLLRVSAPMTFTLTRLSAALSRPVARPSA